MKLVSWNLLRLTGASLDDVVRLIEREQPDLLLMQEVTVAIDNLATRIGGHYLRTPMPKRIHGLGVWSPRPFLHPPRIIALPPGAMFDRVCQIIDAGGFSVANVHLSHGQYLNRGQLRAIVSQLPPSAVIVGDYNLVGPTLLAGFHDVGPRIHTHLAGNLVPLRLDRCLARGVACISTTALPWDTSDHRPIAMCLEAQTPALRRGIKHRLFHRSTHKNHSSFVDYLSQRIGPSTAPSKPDIPPD